MAEKSSVWDCVVYHKLLAAVQFIWSPFFQVHYCLRNCHLWCWIKSRRWGEKMGTQLTSIPWPRVGTCTLPLAFPPSTVLQKINKQLSLAPEIYQHCRQFFSCKARTLSTPPPPPAFMVLSCQLRISYFVPASHFLLAL